MKNYILHKANTRGEANHGWLHSFHTFSFAGYRNDERNNFGNLRVLNDDTVAAGMGFGAHPHDNMEIISIPLSGDLAHKDSIGSQEIIKEGDIQVMSAGTGITHSEYNANKDKEVKFLQIWVFPNKFEVEPRYDQMTFPDVRNELVQIISPNQDDAGLWIHQDAWFHLGKVDSGFETNYEMKNPENGLYIFIIEGDVTIDEHVLNKRDAIGITNAESVSIKANSNAEILLMEVPMQIKY
ncbi:pirin family protein [Paenimyroides tangerinum]|uniref:Pirin family protein n=1 Tax=Paenimyroides tangerinum TaxID=2488728 RepID=A0A3P3WDC1_9FLAO|nr:pirin family protein [Paenimyroides tangerinum]RRJ91619.1 pirin family protein [Paenimyroides tangerinum]